MSRTTATDLSKRRLLRRMPCLLGGMVLAGAVGAQGPQAAGAAAPAHYAGALPAAYRVVNLGAGTISSFLTINDHGQVAYSTDNGTDLWRAMFYDGTRILDLGTLGGPEAFAFAVNNAGQVVGSSVLAGDPGYTHAFLWSRTTGMLDLGTFVGSHASSAFDINNRGEVTGTAGTTSYPHVFRWSAATGMEDLGSLPGAAPSAYYTATAISDSGLIAGWGESATGFPHAFAWTRKTGMVDLGTLGGLMSISSDVDAAGQVVGYAMVPGNLFHAFIWNRHRGMTDLGTAGGKESLARAINRRGQVTGVVISSIGQRGFLWTRPGGMTILGTLGGRESDARDVNDKGQVVGASDTSGGGRHAFVWTGREGMVDLNKRLRYAPAGLVVDFAFAISDNGAIVAASNAGLVLLKPDCGCHGTHAVGPIAVADMVEAGVSFDSRVGFAGADTAAQHNVIWSWGDGSGEQAGFVRESKGAGSAIGSYTYKAPGIYTIGARVTDLTGNSAATTRDVVVYDKAGTMARGSGSFVSPQGAGGTTRSAGGMASFAFIVPSVAAANATAATAQLRFSAGTLNFRSQTLRAVALQGERGQFEGSGKLNGRGDYRFTLATMPDGAGRPGRFALKIWHVDPVTRTANVDYDNLSASPGNAGSAVQGSIVHQQ